MRGRNSFRIISIQSVDQSVFYLMILAAFFLGGCLCGFQYSELCVETSGIVMSEYLYDFCETTQLTVPRSSFLQIAVLFFFYPTTVFFMGLSPLGVLIIPMLSFLLGFGFIFTVQCFLYVFARAGIFPALALLFIRVLVTLICFLILAVEALPQAWRIAQITIKNGKRCESVYHGKRYLVLAFFCLIVLVFGICCEIFFTPMLFRLSLNKIFS